MFWEDRSAEVKIISLIVSLLWGLRCPASKPALAWAPLSVGPPGACSRMGFSLGLSLAIHLLWRGVFCGLQVDIASTVDLQGQDRKSVV